jgi:pyridoxal phosphate enzyme (YggS family)
MIRENLERVRERIEAACQRCGRDPSQVKLVAVTKTVDVERIREAILSGQKCFGENYVQEALPKINALGPGLEWHFIGHLQTNKVKHAVGAFHMIQTLDRIPLARELEKRCQGREPMPVLIQVNVAKEPTKFGIPKEQLRGFLEELVEIRGIVIKGLMTIPPLCEDPQDARPYFSALRELRDQMAPFLSPPHSLDELSMGMTSDMEVAIEEGATMVRVGTAIFGPRPSHKPQ